MDSKIIEIEWHKVLKKEFNECAYEIKFNNSLFPYEIQFSNILNSKFYLCDRWGFITIGFENRNQKKRFLQSIGIEIEHFYNGGVNVRKYNYNKVKYPCRIYAESSACTISFYENEKASFSDLNDQLFYRHNILTKLIIDIKNFNQIVSNQK